MMRFKNFIKFLEGSGASRPTKDMIEFAEEFIEKIKNKEIVVEEPHSEEESKSTKNVMTKEVDGVPIKIFLLHRDFSPQGQTKNGIIRINLNRSQVKRIQSKEIDDYILDLIYSTTIHELRHNFDPKIIDPKLHKKYRMKRNILFSPLIDPEYHSRPEYRQEWEKNLLEIDANLTELAAHRLRVIKRIAGNDYDKAVFIWRKIANNMLQGKEDGYIYQLSPIEKRLRKENPKKWKNYIRFLHKYIMDELDEI